MSESEAGSYPGNVWVLEVGFLLTAPYQLCGRWLVTSAPGVPI